MSKGALSHLREFLICAISSSPRGLPCVDAVPSLFGEPFPITVLQQIKVGLSVFSLALIKALSTSSES